MHALHTQIRKYSGETEKGTYIYLTLSVSYRLSISLSDTAAIKGMGNDDIAISRKHQTRSSDDIANIFQQRRQRPSTNGIDFLRPRTPVLRPPVIHCSLNVMLPTLVTGKYTFGIGVCFEFQLGECL